MNIFVDTYCYIAALNPDDRAHARAVDVIRNIRGDLLTTAWVLCELADGLAKPPLRERFHALHTLIRDDPHTQVVPPDSRLSSAGLELYLDRPDKSWSLTDCISFVVMKERGIKEALTADHHFEQAGFVAMLK